MGRKFQLTIRSIDNGIGATENAPREGEYLYGLGIDPDFVLATSRGKRGGVITPVAYAKMSGANVAAGVIAIIVQPKLSLVYVIVSDGKLISYDASLGSETLVGTATGSVCSGAAYYNNFIYMLGTGASANDVSRYGPLNNSPSLSNGVWTGATLGSQVALTNTTYPNARNRPNHVHIDNKLYHGDYAAGVGYIHYIKTTKVTDEGDTNNGSVYNALDLPFGFKPADIASYGTDLAIGAFIGHDININDYSSMLFLWDTVSDSFYRAVPIPGMIVSAVFNKNGELYVFGGDVVSGGYTLLRYLGGYQFETVYHDPVGLSPNPDAVESDGNRLLWAQSAIPYPARVAGILALGSRDGRLNPRAVHFIAQISQTFTLTASVTAIKNVQLNSGSTPRFMMAWSGTATTAYGIDKYSARTAGTFAGPMFPLGAPFRIDKVRIPLSAAVDANTSIVASFLLDGAQTASTYTRTINNTNDSGKTNVVWKPTPAVTGNHSCALKLVFAHAADGPSVMLPITIDGTFLDD